MLPSCRGNSATIAPRPTSVRRARNKATSAIRLACLPSPAPSAMVSLIPAARPRLPMKMRHIQRMRYLRERKTGEEDRSGRQEGTREKTREKMRVS